jgi:anti-sigma28 factor (negative regulator of flagellin synthesis)
MHSSRPDSDLQHIDAVLTLTPQSRADKIAQLRHAVESGVYGVSAEQIAEKMIREAPAGLRA